MSFAIIRNEKLKIGKLTSTCRHNERLNDNYSNQDIDLTRTKDNYHLVKPKGKNGYEKEFNRIRSEENLKGNLRLTGKKQSNVACEFLITSDNEFFDSIGAEKTKNFFKDALEFTKNKVGEKNIISAVVHMDETTPHMHLVFIPVVQKANSKGITSDRINCSDFWKGFNSYGVLQDEFYEHCIKHGYNLERGEIGSRVEHLEVAEYKAKIAFEKTENAQDKLNNLNDNIQKTQTKAQKQLNAFETRINSFKSFNMRADEIMSLKPQKAFNGAIKGISVEDIENLKKTALAGLKYKLKYDDLLSSNKDLEKKYKQSSALIPSIAEKMKTAEKLSKYYEMKNAFDLLSVDEQKELFVKSKLKNKQSKQKNTNLDEL